MKIEILQLTEGAKAARGLAVIIDVFRAFSTACYVLGRGAREILACREVETAFALRKQHPDALLMGERHERMVEGFHYGNSPFQVHQEDFTGRRVIQTTSAGTRGLSLARQASEVLTGSFVNAGAIVQYIRRTDPREVSLVCMGYAAERPIEEDTFCAEYIRDRLAGRNPDFAQMAETIRKTSGRRFFIPENQSHAPSTDFYLSLDLNRFNFVVRAKPVREGILSLKIIPS